MLDPARPTADFRRPRRATHVADPWAAAVRRGHRARSVTWGVIWGGAAALVIAWVATLGWLLVQGVAWAMDWLT